MRPLFCFIIAFSCCASSSPPNPGAPDLRLLFVGNSLTYSNDLPGLLKELAGYDGIRVSTVSFLTPDYSLEDHWNEGKVQRELKKKHYDYMIAQQGPSALPESQKLLLEYASKLAVICKEEQTTMALYMVWPSKARSFDFAGVIASYANAAEKTGAILCPAGAAWKQAWSFDPTLSLYAADNFHPSLTGSVLAALSIYAKLRGKKDFDFLKGKSLSWRASISDPEAQLLFKAALVAPEK
jgi:hypothetical protein